MSTLQALFNFLADPNVAVVLLMAGLIGIYIEVNNQNPKPLVWTKNADEILASIARFCKRTSGAGH